MLLLFTIVLAGLSACLLAAMLGGKDLYDAYWREIERRDASARESTPTMDEDDNVRA